MRRYLIVLLTPLLLANGDMPPPDRQPTFPPDAQMFRVPCDDQGVCLVPEDVLASGERLKRRIMVENATLRAQLEKLRDSKGCGKVEVLPSTKPKIKPDPTEGGRS